MANALFDSIQVKKPDTARFDLSHQVTQSMKFGELTPTLIMEVIPGDRIKLGCENIGRLAPMTAPVMGMINMYQHYFFVPNRIIWKNFQKFIEDNNSGIVHPFIKYNHTTDDAGKRFLDYCGVPPCDVVGAEPHLNALPLAAYYAIYCEYYADENLISDIDPEDYNLDDGDNTNEKWITMRLRAYEKDYFTSALPWPQKGNAVDIPIGRVQLDPNYSLGGMADPFFQSNAGTLESGGIAQTAGQIIIGAHANAYDPNGTLITEPTLLNDLRTAWAIQRWLELNARGGTRYTELIWAHFAVRSPDARLQRPEYITGVKTPFMISEVVQTSESGTTQQGNMAGHGFAVNRGYNGEYNATEHGWIIGIMSIMPKVSYQQGIPRHWFKTDNFDYAWPQFAHLGEQPIYNKELYAYTADDDLIFGYQSQYASLKFINNRIAGDFRTSLYDWTLARIFGSLPGLDQTFIECTPEAVSRIFAVDDGTDYVWLQLYHIIHANRKIPFYGTPI